MNKGEMAFTLAEILIATFILSFLLLGAYFIFNKSHSAWEKGNLRIEQYQKIRGCLDILTRELKSAFITSSNPSFVFKGKENEVLLTSSSNIPRQKGEYDLKQIKYKLDNSRLIRRVKSNFINPSSSGAVTVLASGVDKVTFSYYNGEKWQSQWDSEKDKDKRFSSGLPRAVGIEFVIREEGEAAVFSTTVTLPVR